MGCAQTTPGLFLTLTTCRVLVMKAFLMLSSVASRLNFLGFASTMRGSKGQGEHTRPSRPFCVAGSLEWHGPAAGPLQVQAVRPCTPGP